MHDRNPPTNSTFIYGNRLYQEWVVDQYSKVEGQRLRWVCLNQTTLRVDQYKGMVDAMKQDGANSTNFGRMVVLLVTAGSPHHMNQLY
jgi:4-hydroxy-3-methylbut-2-enyl diphosphate reductase IspH